MEAKNIEFQKCEVDLRVKAQWHLDVNGGFVPLLENPAGEIIYESAVIAEFASNFAGPQVGLPLWPHEASPGDLAASMATGKMKLQMLKFDKIINANFWGALLSRYQDDEKVAKLKEAIPEIEAFVKANLGDKKFMGGDEPMYIDMHCYPVLERFALLDNSPWQHGWDQLDLKNSAPTVLDFVNRFREHPLMSKHVVIPACNNLHL